MSRSFYLKFYKHSFDDDDDDDQVNMMKIRTHVTIYLFDFTQQSAKLFK